MHHFLLADDVQDGIPLGLGGLEKPRRPGSSLRPSMIPRPSGKPSPASAKQDTVASGTSARVRYGILEAVYPSGVTGGVLLGGLSG